MADFAAARAAEASGFAYGVGREVVVQYERLLFSSAGEPVELLAVSRRAEGRKHQGLCFSAGEQRAAVHAGKKACFCAYRAQVHVGPAVAALAGVENIVAVHFFLQFFERHFDLRHVEFFLADFAFYKFGSLLH